MQKKLLDILVCPKCKSSLFFDKDKQELVCLKNKLAYPVKDGIPVLLIDESRKMKEDELKNFQSQ
ncbi:MAG: Trm112 family protein [Gammaproteobacteria bacterium]|nr:Trm112 family protein [Gammaproteobacteria bacterium]